MSFTLSQLETFTTVVECGSFSAAARRLGKSQSVVSMAISNLEIDLDLTLFDRSEKFPQLTEAGQTLLYSVNAILLHCQNLEERAHTLHQGAETQLRLALDGAIPYGVLETALDEFSVKFPQVDLTFLFPQEQSVVDLVLEKKVHLGLTLSGSYSGKNISFCRLGDVALANVAAAGHPLAQEKDAISFPLLHRYRQLVYAPHERHLPTNEYLLTPSAWLTHSYDHLMDLLRHASGWAIVPKHLIRHELASGEFKELLLAAYPATEWLVGADLIWSSRENLGLAGLWLREYLSTHLCTALENTELGSRRERG